jgi:alkylhydroperoxidase family enzyme
MASSPSLVNGFVGTFGQFHGSAFTGAERQVLLLTNAVTNKSAWAVAFHSTLALGEGVDEGDVERIRRGELPSEPRLAALSALTRSLIEQRGHVGDDDVDRFVGAGFADEQVLDVVAGIGVSTMANYTGNIAVPALEEPFATQSWSAAS